VWALMHVLLAYDQSDAQDEAHAEGSRFRTRRPGDRRSRVRAINAAEPAPEPSMTGPARGLAATATTAPAARCPSLGPPTRIRQAHCSDPQPECQVRSSSIAPASVLTAERAALRKTGLAAAGLAKDGLARTALDGCRCEEKMREVRRDSRKGGREWPGGRTGRGVREDRGDLEAARALDVLLGLRRKRRSVEVR
jgi:hypothetical protein